MPNQTTIYGLTKPLPDEFYDVEVQNDNMDKIDLELNRTQDEIWSKVVKAVSLQRGTNVINIERDTLVSSLAFDGAEAINLVPMFDSGLWKLHANAVVSSPNKIIHNNTSGGDEFSEIWIRVKSNFTYTLRLNHTGLIKVHYYNSSRVILETVVNSNVQEVTFTTSPETAEIKINLHNLTMGEAIFENVMFNEGSTTQPFVANIQPVRFPTIQVKDELGNLKSQLAIQDYFYEGDKLETRDGELVKLGTKKEMNLINPNVAYHSGATGIKRVMISDIIKGQVIQTQDVIKHNGSLLGKALSWADFTTTTKEVGYLTETALSLVIPNADSGWGDTYTPTADEIRAYFMGWVMYESGTTQLYNGTGEKRWSKAWSGSGQMTTLGSGAKVVSNTAVTIVPTVLNDQNYTPYRLIYELAQTEVKPVQTLGELTLKKGINHIELLEGIVARERVKVSYWDTYAVYLINGYNSEPLKYKALQILNVYKNGVVDGNWEQRDHADSASKNKYGEVYTRVTPEHYDPTAQYTVDYLVMPYQSTPVASANAEFPNNLGSVVDKLVSKTKEKSVDLDYLELKKANRLQEDWITPTLLNGWKRYSNYTVPGFYKDDLGIVRIKGMIHGGVSSTIAFVLPKGYRPKEMVQIATVSNTDSVDSLSRVSISDVGNVSVFGTGSWISIDLSFRAEQ